MSSVSSEGRIIKKGYLDKQIEGIIEQHKNEIIKKTLELYLAKDYQVSLDYLLCNYPENSLNEDPTALILMAHLQRKLGELDNAIDSLKNAVHLESSQSYFAHDSLGIIYFTRKEFQTAAKQFEEARNYAQNNYHLHFHVGLCYESILKLKKIETNFNQDEEDENKIQIIQGIKDKIKEAYEEALTLNPNSYHVLLNLGSFNGREGLISAAEKMFKKAVNFCDGDWKIYANLAYLSLMEKEYKLSCEYFEKTFTILDINEAELRVLIPYMIALHKSDNYLKLEKVTKLVLKKDRKNKKALLLLIEALKHNRKYPELIELIKKIRKKLKQVVTDKEIDVHDLNTEISVHYDKIKKKLNSILKDAKKANRYAENSGNAEKSLQKLGDLSDLAKLDSDNIVSFGFNEEEIKKIVQLYKKDKNNKEALFFLGMINFKEGDYEKCEKFFTNLRNINPEFNKGIVSECLGDILIKLHNNPQEALNLYNESLQIEESEIIHVKVGICYELLKKLDEALNHYKKANEINSEFTSASFHMGCIYDKKNNNEEALKWLELTYEMEKENVEYLRKFGEVLIKSNIDNNINKGILILEKGLEFFTGNVDIICTLAMGYEKKKKLKEAIELLETVNNDPLFTSNKSKIFQLASYYEKAKNLTKAIENFKAVLNLEKNNIESLLHMGYIYKSSKEYIKAYKCFSYIIEIDPNNAFAHYGLGRILQLTNFKDNEALENYKKSLEINPNYIKALIQTGIIYLKMKKFDESLNYLNKAFSINDKDILCISAIGNVYIETKDYNKAEEYFKKGLALNKKEPILYVGLGQAYVGMSKFPEAKAKFSEGLNVDSSLPQLHFHLGHCFYLEDKFDEAIKEYTNALKFVKNTRHDYYYYLGQALLAKGRTKDSIKAFQAAIKINPNKWSYYLEIGKALFIEKKFSHAIKYLEALVNTLSKLNQADKEKICNETEAKIILFKCCISLPSIDGNKCKSIITSLIEKEPNNIKYLDCLASVYEKTNQSQEAAAMYRKILNIDPSNDEARKNLKRVESNEDTGKSYHPKKKKKKSESFDSDN